MKKVNREHGSMFSNRTEKQKKLIVKDNITFTTYSFQLSPIENEILDAEALECKALLKRDTSILKNIWARDFTLDDSSTKILMNGKNPLPYYAYLSRFVESFSTMGNIVYTSGYESFQQLKANGELEAVARRNYAHTWTRKYGVWKLSARTYTPSPSNDARNSYESLLCAIKLS
ncbi:MAG TPA: hypothetical protein VL443_23520 [Cyclobacteriaceae bacterium]|nr:hypothetical protein [Cyclobacteriaceae bacterium]